MVLDALDEAARLGLVRMTSAGHTYVHTLVRETIVDSLSIGALAKGHLRIAQHLDEAGAGEPSEVAHHFVQAVPLAAVDDVVRYPTRPRSFRA